MCVKCSEDGKNRSEKIAIINDRALSVVAPLLGTVYCQKLQSLGYIFAAKSICVALQVSQLFYLKARIRQTSRCRTEDRF